MNKEELQRIRKKYNFRKKYNSCILERFEKALDEQWKETDHYIIWGPWIKDAIRKLLKAKKQELDEWRRKRIVEETNTPLDKRKSGWSVLKEVGGIIDKL